jgi:hypothetical protein
MSTNNTQLALAADPAFRLRFKGLLLQITGQILDEAAGTAGHTQRAVYARLVQTNIDTYVTILIQWFVMRTNLFGANTTVSIATGVPVVTTDATDAAILSQIATDWTEIAGA